MNQMINIDENPHAAMFQITLQGLALAESVISSMNQMEVRLNLGSYGMIGFDYLHQLFNQQNPDVITVSQFVQGDVKGHVLFMLNYDTGMQLMRGLLKENARLRELTEMEEEALMEFGNIIINSCLASYLKQYKGHLTSHLPTLERDHYAQVMNEYRSEILDDALFYTQIQIEFLQQSFQGSLLWTRKR
jgi:chemotaxis protein CheC